MSSEVMKSFRKEQGVTQVEMAELIKVSVSNYTKVEGGFKNPSFNFIKKLKDVFPDIDANKFFE